MLYALKHDSSLVWWNCLVAFISVVCTWSMYISWKS